MASTNALVCPQSGRPPSWEEFHARQAAHVICEACGERVELYVLRLDWSRHTDTYKADHKTGLGALKS